MLEAELHDHCSLRAIQLHTAFESMGLLVLAIVLHTVGFENQKELLVLASGWGGTI